VPPLPALQPPDQGQRGFVEARHRPALEIYDRVGGGDSFASGLVYGLVTSADLQTAVEYGAAHGALAMTTPGDTSMASLAEVEALMAGAGARVQRLSLRLSCRIQPGPLVSPRWVKCGAADADLVNLVGGRDQVFTGLTSKLIGFVRAYQ
jgi:pfkB family carbohydrate kinase